jgi:hypothetical protein
MRELPNIALQPPSPASPSPRLSFRTLGGCEVFSAGRLIVATGTGQPHRAVVVVGSSGAATVSMRL